MAHTSITAIVLTILIGLKGVACAQTSPACPATKSKPQAPPLPILPKQFFTRTELTLVEDNITLYLEEYFDQPGNQAEIRVQGLYIIANDSRFISDYDTGEMFQVDDGHCLTSKLDNSASFTFAFNNSGQKDYIKGAQIALNFGKQFNESYVGRETVRNMPVDHWTACFIQGAPLNPQTVNVDYYFLVKDQWAVTGQSSATPVRAVFKTVGMDSVSNTQVYEYMYFQASLPASNEPFLTPPLVYCPGRKNTKPLPTIPRHFKFDAESVMQSAPIVLSYTMVYDYDNELTKITGQPLQTNDDVYGVDMFTEIRDFKAGIRYYQDSVYGNCSVTPINADMMDVIKNNIVFLKNQSSFFNMDVAEFIYVGQRKTRGINTDVWIAQRNNYPPNTNLTTTWEWHFSTPDVYFNSGTQSKTRPVRMALSCPGAGLSYEYNVVNFDDNPTNFFEFDVSACFEEINIQRFEFDMTSGSGEELPDFDYLGVLDAIRTVVIIQTQIGSLRITQVQADFQQKGIHVSFLLLGLPTVTGDSSFNGQPPRPLDTVSDVLRQSIVGSRFKVTISTGGDEITLTAEPVSLKRFVRTEDGQFVEIDEKKTTVAPLPRSTAKNHGSLPFDQCTVSSGSNPNTRRKRAGDPPLPKLPEQFFSRIEFTLINENKTIYLEEYFNKTGDITEIRALGLYDAAEEDRYISSYATKEFFTIEDNQCTVEAIISAETFIFPFKVVNGQDRVMSSQEALQFGNNMNEVYIGPDVVRDIPVHHWKSCVYYSKSNETVTIDFYFAVQTEWTLAAGAVATPLKSVFYIQGYADGSPYHTEYIYEYVYFQDYLPPSNEPFLTPPMVYCPGRKNTRTMPLIPSEFSFRAESVLDTLSLIVTYDMYYDFDTHLTRIDGVPVKTANTEYGTNPFTVIRDFSGGIRYTIDRYLGNCTIAPLDSDITGILNSDGYVQMKNPNQIFYMDGGNYTYVGERKTRDILTDVWVGQRTDFPAGSNKTSTWELHFSKPSDYFNTEDPRNLHPVRFAVFVPDIPLSYQYNVIDFDDSPLDISLFDISPCFVDGEIVRFQLDLITKKGVEVPNFDLIALKKAIRFKVNNLAGVGLLRVQEVEIDYNQKGVHTSFALLGAPIISGNAESTNQPPVLPLDVVASKLKQNIEQGNFLLTVSQGHIPIILSAVQGTLKELIKTEDGKLILVEDLSTTTTTTTSPPTGTASQTPSSSGGTNSSLHSPPTGVSGVSSAVAAGVAVTTAIIGVLLGAGIMYVLHKRRVLGPDIQMERFQ